MRQKTVHPMTGRKSSKAPKRRASKQQTQTQTPQQNQNQTSDDTSPINIKREQPPTAQVVKKILKAENDEARTLKTVFKSNPDTQMRDFIKKAAIKPNQQMNKAAAKIPAENHPPAVAQELLETDDDVADNLARIFKTSKSYKDI